MERDWRETTNLLEAHPETAETLAALLAKQRADGRTAEERR